MLVTSLGKVGRRMNRRWGFEEDDDDIVSEEHPVELLTGEDPDGTVTVTVDGTATVRSVRLAGGWQEAQVRRDLGTRVVQAMTAATTRAMAQAEPAEPPPAPPTTTEPLTAEHVLRLVDAVSRDLGTFRQRLSTATSMTTTTSSGGHVTVSGRRGQVDEVSLDQDWLYGARASEVESELRDALTAFRPTPVGAPRSDAINELLALVADPQAMVRRIREAS